MGDTRLVFQGLLTHLERYANDDNFSQRTMATLISRKIENYWMIIDSDSTVSAILDPRSKLTVFREESKSSARSRIQSIYEIYNRRLNSPVSPTNLIPSTPAKRKNRQYFSLLLQSTNNDEIPIQELEPETELSRYLEQAPDEEAEPLSWWKAHIDEYPTLSKMARDYLTIQATSVASEKAFSIAGNAITKKRSRLLPETVRASLCVKSWMDRGLIKV
jgi:hypothetical protein